jgi:hypothetical protein
MKQKTIVAALVVTLFTGLVTALIRKIGLPVGDPAGLAIGLFATGLAFLEYLDRKWSQTAAHPMSLQDFTISSSRVFFRTFITIVALRQILGAVGVGFGFLAFGTTPPPDRHFLPLTVLILLIAVTVCFKAGKWAGSRVKQHHYIFVTLASLLAVTLGVRIDFVFVPDPWFTRIFIVGKTLEHYVFKILLGWLMYLIPLLIGARTGNRMKVALYLQGLCAGLPEKTQLLVASLVYDELGGNQLSNPVSALRSPDGEGK